MPDPIQIDADFERIARKAGTSVQAARSTFLQELAERIVRATPVDTGRLRASWFFSLTPGRSAPPVLSNEVNPSSGAQVVARLGAGANDLRDADGIVYFLNGANYAIYVEARTQFVRKVVAQAPAIARATISRIAAIRGRRGT